MKIKTNNVGVVNFTLFRYRFKLSFVASNTSFTDSVTRNGPRTNLHLYPLLGLVLFFLISFDSLFAATGSAEAFFSAPDYRTSEGMVRWKSETGGFPEDAEFCYMWSNGDFLKEEYFTRQRTNAQSIILASGRYKGTNWSFKDSALTLQGDLQESALKLRRLLGMPADEYGLSRYLGRGFTLDELSTITMLDDSNFVGKVQGKVPISGVIWRNEDGTYVLNYAMNLQKGPIKYKRTFSLLPISKTTYVVGFLKSYIMRRGTNEVEKDLITVYTTNHLVESLSPWERYNIKETRVRNKDRLYVLNSDSRLSPMLKEGEVPESPLKIKRRRAFIAVFSLLSLSILIYIFYRSSLKPLTKQ